MNCKLNLIKNRSNKIWNTYNFMYKFYRLNSSSTHIFNRKILESIYWQKLLSNIKLILLKWISLHVCLIIIEAKAQLNENYKITWLAHLNKIKLLIKNLFLIIVNLKYELKNLFKIYRMYLKHFYYK